MLSICQVYLTNQIKLLYYVCENAALRLVRKSAHKYQYEIGERVSLDQFADYLGISQGYLSQLMNGARKGMGRNTALVICQKLNDYSLLDILGYARPQPDEMPVPFSALPPELQSLLRSALLEIDQALKSAGAQADSAEALRISTEILKKHGLAVESVEIGGSDE